MILNSFIVSNTHFQQVGWWDGGMSKEELNNRHVLFQKEDQDIYIERILSKAVSNEQAAVEA